MQLNWVAMVTWHNKRIQYICLGNYLKHVHHLIICKCVDCCLCFLSSSLRKIVEVRLASLCPHTTGSDEQIFVLNFVTRLVGLVFEWAF